MRKLSYYVAVSIDGFIGAPDGEASFFSRFVKGEYLDLVRTESADTLPTAARRLFGVDDQPVTRFDTVIQGRGSYDVGLAEGIVRPYAHLRELVVSRSITEAPDPAIEIVCGDVVARVRELKAEDGLDIYLCGGANLAGQLRDEVDELIIKTYPVILGTGMPMFAADFRIDEFALESLRSFDNGVVLRTYRRER
ncbi:dihydrofolate reductase family protein [Streptomyces sp. NPDC000594]|uniref:dihydrofolate reductase family protein n=1 Tax=Streptomyces sp. NPDC000594 TaxID=3154261 RepID=UPI00331F1B7D